MTVTYNGSKITTGTLYEDGTIEVKPGLNKFDIKQPRISSPSIVSAKSKTKVFSKNMVPENVSSSFKYSSINSAKSKTKIWQKTLIDSEADNLKLGVPSIASCRTKVVIVTP